MEAQSLGGAGAAMAQAVPQGRPAAPFPPAAHGSPAASPIADFFRGRCVLVTGATGFMGKVLVEKLLRSCPDLATIFLLMRPKRGQDVRSRLDQLLAATLFDSLRRERPDALNKVVPVAGDLTQPELGISAGDQRILADSVSVVFHAAATVKFDEKLKLSVAMNVQGTSRLVQLCHKMSKLEALLHVSTAYCNCHLSDVEERVYPPPADPDQIAQFVDWMDEDLIDSITPKIVGDRPNTYTFTKALAEHVLVSQAGSLPAAIVRPSIVTASWREPLPGWVDNLNGPTGLLAGAGKGLLRTMFCYRDLVADVVPVDIAINLLLAVAWHTAVNRPNGIVVYNCTSGTTNPLKWGDIEMLGREFVRKIPFSDIVWYPGGSFKSNRVLNAACHVALHLAPAYVLDAAARLAGRKPIMVRIHQKMSKAVGCLEYFTTHEWRFHNHNVRALWARLEPAERQRFPFDVRAVEWRAYFEEYVRGTRSFILKEDPGSLPAARKQMRRMYALHVAVHVAALLVLGRLLLLRSPATRRACYELLELAVRLGRYLWPV